MRGRWEELGVVETIYEEEQEDDASYSPSVLTHSRTTSPSPPHSSSSPTITSSLRSRVEEWSRATGCKTDVVIRVHDRCFLLHKEPLVSHSGYLRRQLASSSDVTVSPPSTITAETFAAVADFCYGADVALMPSNVAAFRIAAEWLEMAAENGGDGNLVERTEAYFRQVVVTAAGVEDVRIVLRTCLGLLPESEAAAADLAGRCLEALAAAEDGDGGWLDEMASIAGEDFQMIAGSMRLRCTRSHDLLYRMVSYYFENHRGQLTEEEKTRICYSVDSRKLSPRLLMHLIQNPNLPLRFIVQAMLVEQLQTRHSIAHHNYHPITSKPRHHHHHHHHASSSSTSATLGTILQRDAALRQAAHLRATMEATSFRIQSLERDLAAMKRRLRRSAATAEEEAEPGRSESLRFFGPEERADVEGWGMMVSLEKPGDGNKWSFGRMLVHGIRSVFRKPTTLGSGGGEDVVVVEERHRSNHSLT